MSEAWSFLRYVTGLRSFLREPLTPEACRRRLREGLAAREASFLALLERGVFGNPRSPYRPLLDRAGAELGDVARLVEERGVEGALGRLHDEGVYVTLEEFKRRRPLVRPGREVEAAPDAFDNPLLGPARVTFESRGSRGRRRRAMADLAHIEHDAVYLQLFLDAFDALGRPRGLWRPVPPGASGLKSSLGYAKLGLPVERWFSQTPVELNARAWRDYLVCRSSLFASRLWGVTVPQPRHVPLAAAAEIASWLAERSAAGTPALLDTTASSGVRVCAAARAGGLDLAGTLLRFGGEPLTEAKARIVDQVGARVVCHYSMSELGRVGLACAAPGPLDDVHLVTDKVAIIQRQRQVGAAGARVGALLVSTLVPSCPKLMLNVETDDYGVLERRDCGCLFGELGLESHLHTIRSYEKLTSEGMHFLGSELVSVIEQVLPDRFGGGATDYQLVEEEVDGLPKVGIVVSPRLGALDEGELARAVLEALGRGSAASGMMAGIWADGRTLEVIRREPYATASAKILPLHVLER